MLGPTGYVLKTAQMCKQLPPKEVSTYQLGLEAEVRFPQNESINKSPTWQRWVRVFRRRREGLGLASAAHGAKKIQKQDRWAWLNPLHE